MPNNNNNDQNKHSDFLLENVFYLFESNSINFVL